jgi:hypothetical protein
MTEQAHIERPKVYQAFICDIEGNYELREFFWSETSARECLEEALDEFEPHRYEYEWGVTELYIEE